MSTSTILVWFRHDLRLADNRALIRAAVDGAHVIPIYILDDETPGRWRAGGASRWWLHHSLASLADDLEMRGSRLVLRRGNARDVLPALASETKATAVHCSRAYQPWAAVLESDLKAKFDRSGITFRRFTGTLLFEPESLRTKAGEPFKVYTPFWRAAQDVDVHPPEPAHKQIPPPSRWPKSDNLASWKLLPTRPDWSGGFRETWTPGSAGATRQLERFLKSALVDYADARNRPDQPATSRLSPHLAFGEISPATIWHRARHAANGQPALSKGLEVFLKELAWREFSYHLLTHWPTLPEHPFRPEFARFPWRNDAELLHAWQKGRTGYPIVDAGMRELWHTGAMHNRVRMISASFLIKDLMISWQTGEAWFWDTLVDADLASNAASWQWVAGSGADAAPYFRIFNPSKQGETFDPDGAYVRRWVPELARLPNDLIHRPWEASAMDLRAAAIELGKDYPTRIVDHAAARDQALLAFKQLRAV